MDLDSAAEELYGAPAEEFARHRTRLAAQAKAAGDKQLAASIGKLRKPVLAAALINELVRNQPPELAELTELAQQLRTAHRELRGPELRALSAQRQQLLQRLTELVRQFAEENGRGVTEPVLMQVRSTLEAAIADEGAQAAALSGRLTTALSYSGFGEVDVSDAVAVPVRKRHLRSVPDPGTETTSDQTADQSDEPAGAPPAKAADRATPARTADPAAPRKTAGRAAATEAADEQAPAEDLDQRAQLARDSAAEQARQRRLERRQLELERAEAQHAKAVRALEQAEQDVLVADQHEEQASARVEQLIAELSQAQELARQAGQASRAAERERRAAEQEADRAAAAVREAREQLH